MQKIYLASDHGGFVAKEQLKLWLTTASYAVEDLGPATYDADDDYPVYAARVAKALQDDPRSLGILLCRSGQGVSIVANKFAGIRAALAWNQEVAVAARADDNANILCLPADYLSASDLQALVQVWLETNLQSEAQYARRLEEIHAIEAQNFGAR